MMPLRMEVGLGPGDIVLDGSPAPPKGGTTAPPHFSTHVCCGHTAGWIKIPLVAEVGLSPGDIVLDGEPSSPTKKRHSSPHFSAQSLVAKRLDESIIPLGTEVDLIQAILSQMGT